jgi:DNA mismatch endonuclease, patch repair protein
MPEENRDYWLRKIVQNKERDEAARTALTKLGWDVGIIWECQMKDRDIVAKKLRSFLG